MTDRYINPSTGVNTGAGTLAAPWKDLEYALEGNRCTEGDTIYLMAGDYSNIFVDKVTAGQNITLAITANAHNPLTIQPYNGAEIEIAVPLNSGGFFLNYGGYYLKWIGVGFTNPNNLSRSFVLQRSGGSGVAPEMYFEDCYFDKCGSGTNTNQFFNMTTTTDATPRTNRLTLNRCKIKADQNWFVSFEDQSRDSFYCTMTACDIEITGSQKWFQIPQNTELTFINNNMRYLSDNIIFLLLNTTANKKITVKNNRFDRSSYYNATEQKMPFFATTDAAYAFYVANPSMWDVTNNLFWDDYCDANLPNIANAFFNSSYNNYQKQMVYDKTNIAIDLISANGYGDYAALPTKALLLNGIKPVIGGDSWFASSDTGCYKNTSGTRAKYTVPNTLVFFGDSISANITRSSHWNTLGSGITAVTRIDGTSIGAIGGIGYRELLTLVDWSGWNTRPEWGVLSIGVNNVAGLGAPAGITNQEMTSQIIELMKKIQFWGIKPIWLGMPSLKGSDGGATVPQAINALVEPICKANGWAYGNVLSKMMKNVSWQTAYYNDFTNDVHPNDAGQKVMAEYALQLVNEARSSGNIYGTAKRYVTSTRLSRNFH